MGFQIENGVLVKYTEEPGITEVAIPEGVISIGDRAFEWCENLTNIVIPEGVISIGRMSFQYCRNLDRILFPASLTAIGGYAFQFCSNLINLNIAEGITIIEDGTFRGCKKLTSIIISEGITSIGKEAFSWCESLTSLVLPEGITSIGDEAFRMCTSLTSIIIPASVTNIGGMAFRNCSSISNILIPDNVTTIGDGAFEDCYSLTSVLIPQGVMCIGNKMFRLCKNLVNITIPASVNSIGDEAFYGCTGLASIVIPASITSIGKDAFWYCPKLKEVHCILSLINNGCKIHVSTYTWLVENIWNGPEYLSETAQVYLTNPGKAVNEICESRLFEDFTATADVMLGLIETNKSNASALKKIATFASTCGGELPREKLIAIYEALKEIGAKPAVKLLEKAVQSDSAPTLEGGTGHPIEAFCLKRFKEAVVDKGLKDYGISPKLFEGVHYKSSKTLAPAFVIKCAIFPYMQKLKELPRSIGGYQTDFVEVEPDPQIDEIAKTLEREELQELLQSLIHQFDPFKWRLLLPYCRYGSGKQMNAIAAMIKKWQVWGDFDAAGRRFIIVLHGAMMLSDTREAMFLMEKWGMFDAYARTRNTTAEVLRDSVLTEFDLDSDGSKHYNLGNSIIAASINQDLTLSLFNETTGKEVKSLPKRGADEEKYAAASAEFADLKKNIKNAVKNRVARFKENFVSPVDVKASDWKSSYTKNYVLKRLASLLVWQWQHKESAFRFMLEMDGIFIDCTGRPVEVADIGSIILAHPVEIPTEELDCWKTLLTEKQIAQPFVQMFEPVCELDPSVVVSQYEGIELPMFLLRGLAKEGVKDIDFMYEGSWLHIQGKAITINASVISGGYFYTERAIPFDAVVSLNEVKFVGTPRAVNHEIYAMDKALIENRVRNGDIVAVEAFSRGITGKTIQDLIDVSMQVDQMEVTAWLMNYKNDHFPYTFADLEL